MEKEGNLEGLLMLQLPDMCFPGFATEFSTKQLKHSSLYMGQERTGILTSAPVTLANLQVNRSSGDSAHPLSASREGEGFSPDQWYWQIQGALQKL